MNSLSDGASLISFHLPDISPVDAKTQYFVQSMPCKDFVNALKFKQQAKKTRRASHALSKLSEGLSGVPENWRLDPSFKCEAVPCCTACNLLPKSGPGASDSCAFESEC